MQASIRFEVTDALPLRIYLVCSFQTKSPAILPEKSFAR